MRDPVLFPRVRLFRIGFEIQHQEFGRRLNLSRLQPIPNEWAFPREPRPVGRHNYRTAS